MGEIVTVSHNGACNMLVSVCFSLESWEKSVQIPVSLPSCSFLYNVRRDSRHIRQEDDFDALLPSVLFAEKVDMATLTSITIWCNL